MGELLISDLVWVALVMGVLSALLASRQLSAHWAILLAVVRVAIPLVYFTICADDLWNDLDDLSYFEQGRDLLARGFNPLTAWKPEGIETMQSLSDGGHILYCWFNLLAQYLFGEHYYSPIFFNVFLTFVMAGVVSSIAGELGFPERYRRGLYIFLLLHWDVLTWSSLMNLKDIVVLTMTVCGFYCCIHFLRYRKKRHAAGLLAITYLFDLIRFYVPLLMGVAVILWTLTQWRDARKYIIVAAAIVLASPFFPMIAKNSDLLNPASFAFGSANFIATPAPWKIEEGSYLLISSIMHWIMLPSALIGALLLWRNSPWARMMLFYALVIVAFYATVEDLRGPRQRFQIVFIIAWAQFHFLWATIGLMQRAARPAQPARLALPRAKEPASLAA